MNKTYDVVLGQLDPQTNMLKIGGTMIPPEVLSAAIIRCQHKPVLVEFRDEQCPPIEFDKIVAGGKGCKENQDICNNLSINKPVGCVFDLHLDNKAGVTSLLGQLHIGGPNSENILKFLEGKDPGPHIAIRGITEHGKLLDIHSYDIVANKA